MHRCGSSGSSTTPPHQKLAVSTTNSLHPRHTARADKPAYGHGTRTRTSCSPNLKAMVASASPLQAKMSGQTILILRSLQSIPTTGTGTGSSSIPALPQLRVCLHLHLLGDAPVAHALPPPPPSRRGRYLGGIISLYFKSSAY
jgi:hypothetical protein